MNSRLNQIQDWLPLAQHANWSVTRLAKLCKVSVRTIERHFLKTIGKAPKAWMTEQRQMQAVKHLRNGSLVKETASLLGYRHAATFTREFKKIYGQNPTF